MMLSFLLLAFCLTAASPSLAQMPPEKEEAEYDMGRMQMVLLIRTPRILAADESLWVWRANRAYTDTLMSRGKIAFSGVSADTDTLAEILVIKADSLEDGRKLAANLPAVSSGVLEPRLLTWFAARNFLTPATKPLKRTDYIFGILVRGPKWTPETTAESEKIQKGHMANITKLHDAGKLILAGPFVDGGDARGVFIFKVPTIAEAQKLTETDPAVKAGRLRIELHRVSVPEGVLR